MNESDLGWRCFTRCEPGYGDALDFVQRRYGLDFKGAIDWLRDRVGVTVHPRRPQVRPAAAPKPRVPTGEAQALWAKCVNINQDVDAAGWVTERWGGHVQAQDVERLDLARALLRSVELPPWASSWAERGHRLIVPMFDATGRVESLRARSLLRPAPENKELAPRGYRVAGLVMANELGQRLLAAEEDAVAMVRRGGIWVAEGVTDFIALATRPSNAAPAVFGIVNGSWTPEIAARVPDDAEVVLATDADEVGEKYARQIIGSLKSRRVRFWRWTP